MACIRSLILTNSCRSKSFNIMKLLTNRIDFSLSLLWDFSILSPIFSLFLFVANHLCGFSLFQSTPVLSAYLYLLLSIFYTFLPCKTLFYLLSSILLDTCLLFLVLLSLFLFSSCYYLVLVYRPIIANTILFIPWFAGHCLAICALSPH